MSETATSSNYHNPISGPHVRVLDCLVGGQSCAENGSNGDGVDVVWQERQITGIKRDVLLEASIFMVEVIRALDAVLFCSGKTELAPPADAACKADANKTPNLDVVTINARTQGDDTANALVAPDVRQFDLRDGLAVGTGCGAELCV
jgi:hypothetical protein